MKVNSGKVESERFESARRSRAAVELREGLAKRVATYAAAAGAAGVGILALAPSAKADIIYTPANQTLTNGTLSIDLNHDGISDFQFGNFYLNCFGYSVRPKSGSAGDRILCVNGRLGQAANQVVADALPRGAVIGPGDLFRGGVVFMAGVSAFDSASGAMFYTPFGPWANVKDRFLGLQFDILGQPHYGWAELSVSTGPGFNVTATLQGYAYDTVPAQSLTAGQGQVPEPGSLGLLALGSLGLALWRRRKNNVE